MHSAISQVEYQSIKRKTGCNRKGLTASTSCVSVLGTVAGLSAISQLSTTILAKIFGKTHIYSADSGSSSSIVQVLIGADTEAVKLLITNMDVGISSAMMLIQKLWKKCEKARGKRRRCNKQFVACLVKEQGDLPKALVWFKHHITPTQHSSP